MSEFAALNVLVLAGGISHERDVSLRSGRRVAEALGAAGHRVSSREPDGSLMGYLAEHTPDLIWPALHGASGEDGALRALLELTGIPFVGALSGAARLAWLKPTAKTLLRRAGLHTPESVSLSRGTFRELGASSVLEVLHDRLQGELVVKPAEGGSAQGVSIVTEVTDLPRALVEAYTYSDVALIERRVGGTEVAVSVVDLGDGPLALPPVEIQPVSGVYSFEARYNAGETLFYTPARLTDGALTAVTDLALQAHRILGLRHLSRVDVIVDDGGAPWFLEANVLPGLTETSLLPIAVEADGRTLPDVYAAIAALAAQGGAPGDR